jgi:peptide/nickel transport system permease protein
MNQFHRTLEEIKRYPSAIAGVAIIIVLVIVAIYAVVTIPYDEAIRTWRSGEEVWYNSPKNARPVWVNWFRQQKLPETIVLNSKDPMEDAKYPVEKRREVVDAEKQMTDVIFSLTFDYPYDVFPRDMILFFNNEYEEKAPYISLTWLTSDGREVRIADISAEHTYDYRFSQDEKLQRRLGGLLPHIGLFVDPAQYSDSQVTPDQAIQGTYTLEVRGLVFEEDADVDAELVIYGQVHGIAGTDHRRRDLRVALLWGTPIALSFGLLAAVGTTVTTMVIAAIGTWMGGWVDEAIQRITEVNLILPVLPILIMVGTFHSRSIWTMLSVIIVLNIFGGAIKAYRALFLQVKESPYIEAARAYGASDLRIILYYLVPRIIPLLVPRLVVLVPNFVFLEASLAVLGLGDPTLPTWGKLINEARINGALYQGYYYWMLEPAVLLMGTGLAFALVGFSLDRIFNPRLRGM